MHQMYSVDYFIEKFSAIPKEKWNKYTYQSGDKRCGTGHCGVTNDLNFTDWPLEAMALHKLFESHFNHSVATENDKLEHSAKVNVLNALEKIKVGRS